VVQVVQVQALMHVRAHQDRIVTERDRLRSLVRGQNNSAIPFDRDRDVPSDFWSTAHLLACAYLDDSNLTLDEILSGFRGGSPKPHVLYTLHLTFDPARWPFRPPVP